MHPAKTITRVPVPTRTACGPKPRQRTYMLEEISAPTLIINAKDDGLSAFGNAAQASRRIRRSKLMAIDHGGHLLLGSEDRIKKEIAAFDMAGN